MNSNRSAPTLHIRNIGNGSPPVCKRCRGVIVHYFLYRTVPQGSMHTGCCSELQEAPTLSEAVFRSMESVFNQNLKIDAPRRFQWKSDQPLLQYAQTIVRQEFSQYYSLQKEIQLFMPLDRVTATASSAPTVYVQTVKAGPRCHNNRACTKCSALTPFPLVLKGTKIWCVLCVTRESGWKYLANLPDINGNRLKDPILTELSNLYEVLLAKQEKKMRDSNRHRTRHSTKSHTRNNYRYGEQPQTPEDETLSDGLATPTDRRPRNPYSPAFRRSRNMTPESFPGGLGNSQSDSASIIMGIPFVGSPSSRTDRSNINLQPSPDEDTQMESLTSSRVSEKRQGGNFQGFLTPDIGTPPPPSSTSGNAIGSKIAGVGTIVKSLSKTAKCKLCKAPIVDPDRVQLGYRFDNTFCKDAFLHSTGDCLAQLLAQFHDKIETFKNSEESNQSQVAEI